MRNFRPQFTSANRFDAVDSSLLEPYYSTRNVPSRRGIAVISPCQESFTGLILDKEIYVDKWGDSADKQKDGFGQAMMRVG